MEQPKNAATTARESSSNIQELAALSKRLDFTKKKGVNWAPRCHRKPRMGDVGLRVLHGVYASGLQHQELS